MGQHFGAQVLDPRSEDVVNHVRARTSGIGVDAVVDAVGITLTRKQCIEAVAPGGRVVFLGLHDEESALPANLFVRKEISLHGTYAYTPSDFEDALRWLAAGRIEMDPWLLKIPLSSGRDAFERLLDKPGSVAKILLSPER